MDGRQGETLTKLFQVETVLDSAADMEGPVQVLDLGTGSGCLMLSILAKLSQSVGTGLDISQPALDVARLNASRLGLDNRCTFVQGSWAGEASLLKQQCYDIIVCNPPYVSTAELQACDDEVREWEPYAALFGGDDGLDEYRSVLPVIARVLRPVLGVAALELPGGEEDAANVANIAESAKLRVVDIKSDYSHRPRVLLLKSS